MQIFLFDTGHNCGCVLFQTLMAQANAAQQGNNRKGLNALNNGQFTYYAILAHSADTTFPV